MKAQQWCLLAGSFALMLSILSCNISYNMGSPPNSAVAPETMVVETLTALAAQPITATDTLTPASPPTNTNMPSALVTANGPVVISDTLCWQGPGPSFVVSSSILTGTSVVLLGQGSLPGWWIVSDPIYHDPCWIYKQDLEIDPNFDLSNLQTFYPPSTLTPTLMPTLTPTPIPSSVSTPVPTS